MQHIYISFDEILILLDPNLRKGVTITSELMKVTTINFIGVPGEPTAAWFVAWHLWKEWPSNMSRKSSLRAIITLELTLFSWKRSSSNGAENACGSSKFHFYLSFKKLKVQKSLPVLPTGSTTLLKNLLHITELVIAFIGMSLAIQSSACT